MITKPKSIALRTSLEYIAHTSQLDIEVISHAVR